MTLKKTLPLLTLTLAIALFMAGLAAAQKTGKEGGPPPPPPPKPQVSQADMEAWHSLRLEHMEKIGPLRDQLWAKKMEYEALTLAGEVNMPEIRAVIEDMVKLKARIREERTNHFSRMKEKGLTGPAWGHGDGWFDEKGCPGGGPGYGPGDPGGKDRRPGKGRDNRMWM